MKKIVYLLIFATMLFSCGNKTEKLNFSKFEIKDQNGVTGIKVDDKGGIYVDGQQSGKVQINAEIKDKSGKVIAKLNDDDILLDSENKPLIKINRNGDMDNGSGVLMKWDENGELMKGDEKTGMSIIPNDKKSYRTASIIVFLYLNFGK